MSGGRRRAKLDQQCFDMCWGHGVVFGRSLFLWLIGPCEEWCVPGLHGLDRWNELVQACEGAIRTQVVEHAIQVRIPTMDWPARFSLMPGYFCDRDNGYPDMLPAMSIPASGVPPLSVVYHLQEHQTGDSTINQQ